MAGRTVFLRTAAAGGAYARSRLNRISVAVGIIAVAAVTRWALNPIVNPNVRWFVFFPAVLFATLYGRLLGGIISIFLAVLLTSIFWSPDFSVPSLVSIMGFIIAASLMAWSTELSLRARRDLELERKFLNIVLAAATDRLAVLDADWRCLFVDEAAQEVTGKFPNELIGQSIWEIFPRLKEPDFERELHRCRREDVAVHFEFYSPVENRWLLFRAQPIGHDCIMLYVADVSAHKRIEKDRERAQEQAAVLERVVSERTASLEETVAELDLTSHTIGHNLRAPLRTMEAFSGFLIHDYGDKLDATGRDYLNRIKAAAQRLDQLIEALLSYSRVSRSEVQSAAVDLDRLIDEVVAEHAKRDDVHISHPLGCVTANEPFLAQAVSNLLDNAAKFVQPGMRPQITISTKQSAGKLRLIVDDQGIGIPRETGDRIFRAFERAHEGYPGLGIGLAVVKRAVERMDGRVGFDSKADHGCSFWIELPMAVVKPSQPESSQPASPDGAIAVQE